MQPLAPRSLFLHVFLVAFLIPAHAQSSNPDARERTAAAANSNLKVADAAFRAGSAAYQQNDLHTAHTQFAKVVRLAPTVAAGHTAFGTVLLAEGDPRSAVAELEQAHRLDRRDPSAISNLALAYTQLRDYAKTVKLFQLLNRSDINSPQPLAPEFAIAYATSLAAISETAAAQKQLELALTSAPENAALHDALGAL